MEKGEKRSFHALFEHIQFCERSMKRSALKYPWQLGFMADSDQSAFPKGPLGMSPVLPAAVSSSDHAEPADEKLASAFDDHCRRLYCKLLRWSGMCTRTLNVALLWLSGTKLFCPTLCLLMCAGCIFNR